MSEEGMRALAAQRNQALARVADLEADNARLRAEWADAVAGQERERQAVMRQTLDLWEPKLAEADRQLGGARQELMGAELGRDIASDLKREAEARLSQVTEALRALHGRCDAGPNQCVACEALSRPASSPAAVVAGEFMERSIASFVRACEVHIEAEQGKPLPDNSLIAVLADAIRLTRELARSVGAAFSPAAAEWESPER